MIKTAKKKPLNERRKQMAKKTFNTVFIGSNKAHYVHDGLVADNPQLICTVGYFSNTNDCFSEAGISYEYKLIDDADILIFNYFDEGRNINRSKLIYAISHKTNKNRKGKRPVIIFVRKGFDYDQYILPLSKKFDYPNIIKIEVNGSDDIINYLHNFKPLYIEGTDLIGKTTIRKRLASLGYVCFDRMDDFSKCITSGKKIDKIVTDLNNIDFSDMTVLILTTSNDKDLVQRIALRKEKSEHDYNAVQYNHIYHDIVKRLSKPNIIEVDVTGDDIDEKVQRIVGIIEDFKKKNNK